MIVLDTSVLIDHLRGRPEAHRALRGAVEEGQLPAGSVLTKIEIATGMRSTERGAVETLFRALEWLPMTTPVADDADVLARRYRRSHASIDVVDYVIAATARSVGATVWNINVKHFPMIEGIRPPF